MASAVLVSWSGASFDPCDPLDIYTYAVMGLPSGTREVFLLHRIEAMDYPEIARTLRIAVTAVEAHMITALCHVSRIVDVVAHAQTRQR